MRFPVLVVLWLEYYRRLSLIGCASATSQPASLVNCSQVLVSPASSCQLHGVCLVDFIYHMNFIFRHDVMIQCTMAVSPPVCACRICRLRFYSGSHPWHRSTRLWSWRCRQYVRRCYHHPGRTVKRCRLQPSWYCACIRRYVMLR